jgi:hypothetical protein
LQNCEKNATEARRTRTGEFLVLLPAGRRPIMPVMDEPLPAAVQPAEEPLQFSLRAIMIAQAVCALFCGLFVMAGIFALLAAFAVTLIYCWVGVRPENARLKRFLVDLLGGAVFPVLCVLYDPVVFRGDGWFGGANRQAFAYVAIAFQIVALLCWLAASPWCGRLSAVFAGVLFAGAIMAVCIGVPILPLSIIGLIVLIGLLGFAPFLTAYVFFRNSLYAWRQAGACSGRAARVVLFVLGALLATAAPVLLYFVAGEWVLAAIKLIPWPAPKPFM